MNAIATATSSVTTKKNVRIPKLYPVREAFPEISGPFPAIGESLKGFAEPGRCVPLPIDGFTHDKKVLARFVVALHSASSWVILLWGASGAGKSSLVHDFCARLNRPLLGMSVDARTQAYQLVGSEKLVEGENGPVQQWVDGDLVRAMKAGCIYLLDEGFKLDPEVTSRFHTLRDRGVLNLPNGEVVQARPGFKLVITSNQGGYGDMTGMHPGDRQQDIAWLNGAAKIKVTYPAPEVEVPIIQHRLVSLDPCFGTDPALMSIAPAMVKIANQARAISMCNPDASPDSTDRIEVVFSTRDLLNWAEYFVAFRGADGDHPLYQAIDMVMLDSACPATRSCVDTWIKAETGHSRS